MASSLPIWLTDAKQEATKTKEWNDLTKNIYDAVDQHMSQSHVKYFTDLTESEKCLLMERAARSLQNSDGRVYDNLQSKLSYLLDQSVNNQVAKRMLEDTAPPDQTKTDFALETTAEGVVALLRKYPEQKYKLHAMLNQVIPQPIRFVGWQLFFSNPTYRKEFQAKLGTNPKLCLSPKDAEIQQKCESILSNSPLFKDMKNSKGNLNSMKGILSYYHVTTKPKNALLSESEYLYAIPFVNSHYPALPRNESPTEKSMAMLIEMYLQFMHTLPTALQDVLRGNADSAEMELLVKNVMQLLHNYDEPLLEHIRDLARRTSPPGIEDITFQTAFKTICTPMMRDMFVGYLALEPLMFVWDQYTISCDVPGYHEDLLPIITAVILMILRDQLMATRSLSSIDECIKMQSAFIQTRQLQAIINKYFFRTLQTKLNSMSTIGPVIDPTAGPMQPWEHWHQDVIPTNRNRFPRQQAETDDRLQQEINRRLQSEKASQEEIERLQREIEYLRKQPKQVVYNMPPPQPQPRQRTPPVSKQQPQQAAKPVTQQPTLDLINRLKSSVNKIAHGDGTQEQELDRQSAEDLRLHKLDLKIAEQQVFGRKLSPYEWENLSDAEKKRSSEQMLEIVKSRLQKRYNETGRF